MKTGMKARQGGVLPTASAAPPVPATAPHPHPRCLPPGRGAPRRRGTTGSWLRGCAGTSPCRSPPRPGRTSPARRRGGGSAAPGSFAYNENSPRVHRPRLQLPRLSPSPTGWSWRGSAATETRRARRGRGVPAVAGKVPFAPSSPRGGELGPRSPRRGGSRAARPRAGSGLSAAASPRSSVAPGRGRRSGTTPDTSLCLEPRSGGRTLLSEAGTGTRRPAPSSPGLPSPPRRRTAEASPRGPRAWALTHCPGARGWRADPRP